MYANRDNSANYESTGICIFEIADFFSRAGKTVRLILQEVLVEKVESEMTYFDIEEETE